MSEQQYEAISKRNPETGSDYLHTCTLVVGDGSTKVDFNQGRAMIPASLLDLFKDHPHVSIPALSGRSQADVDEIESLRERLAKLEAAQTQVVAADPAPPPAAAVAVPQAALAAEPEQPSAVDLAAEYLREEGEDVPDVDASRPNPADKQVSKAAGNVELVATTDDQQPRCQALKGDGSQCANPARDGQACHLPAHKKQLAPATD